MVFWAISFELFCGSWNHPHQVEEVNYTMTRWLAWHSCHSSENWPQGNRNKLSLGLKTNYPWNNQDEADQTAAWPISRCLSELTVLFLHVTLFLLLFFFKKKKGPLTVSQGNWPWDESLPFQTWICPSCLVASLWNKANFPFHQLCLFIGFRGVSNPIPLLVI